MKEVGQLPIKEKIQTKEGINKINIQCWIEFINLNLNYSRYISLLEKKIKTKFFELREIYKENFYYFLDLDIRNSPSKSAFLSITVSLIDPKKNRRIPKLKIYLDELKNLIIKENNIKIFFNEKKRKP